MQINKNDVLLYLNPLCFEENEVKDQFNSWYSSLKIIQIRAITILTAFLYIIYSQIDIAIDPFSAKPIMTLLHLYVLPLSLFFIAGLTFWDKYYRVMILLLSIAPVVAAIGNIYIIFLLMHFLWLFSAFSFGLVSAFIIEKSNKLNFLNNQKLEYLANTDELTGLYNRSRIENNVNDEVERAERYKRVFSIILLDIDHFKSVNDDYGHHVGDVILSEFASVLKGGIRKVDAVGRWGGEEFLIILPETNIKEAENIAEQIRKKIENHIFTVIKHKTSSFGVSEYIQGDNSQSIINRADKALYKAKDSGRNTVQSL